MPDLKLSEDQVVELTRQLSPQGRRKVLQTLIAVDTSRFEKIVGYGETKIREICIAKGINWDALSDEERQQVVDDLLHQG